MSRDPSEFYGVDGEVPWPKLRKFIRFVLADSARSFSGIRVHQRRTGKTLIADLDSPAFRGAWSVSLRGRTEALVGPGTVNGIPARSGLLRLDGTDDNGEPLSGGPPVIDLSLGPDERGRSYLFIRVEIDPATGAIDPENLEAVQVLHRREIPEPFDLVGSEDVVGWGWRPIAQLTWSGDRRRVVAVNQWLYFHQSHRYIPGENGRRGRHRFEPVV